MNCTDIDTHIDDYLDADLPAAEQDAFSAHLANCADCQQKVDEMKVMISALKDLPAVEPRAEFESRVFGEVRRQHRDHYGNKFLAGFATAMAASLAIWFASTLYLPQADVGQPEMITVALNDAKTVRLNFDAPSDIAQVSLTIGLPDNIEMQGYKGQKLLAWQTSLKKGHNVLSLPLTAVDLGQGELVAQLSYGDKLKTFRIMLKTSHDGALNYQIQAMESV